MMDNSDIIEIRLLDSSYNPYFKIKAKVKDKQEMEKLMKDLKLKGVYIVNDSWF